MKKRRKSIYSNILNVRSIFVNTVATVLNFRFTLPLLKVNSKEKEEFYLKIMKQENKNLH